MKNKVACIGSRQTPFNILLQMEKIGKVIVEKGFIVSSGNAKGADQSFAKGGNQINPKNVILYLPWNGLNEEQIVEGNKIEVWGGKENFDNELKEVHGQWGILRDSIKNLHRRNYGIIENSICVICYTIDGNATGGTGVGMRLAHKKGIPIFNLYFGKNEEKRFFDFLNEYEKTHCS